MTKAELKLKLIKLEDELHEYQNSSEYWSHEYHKLLVEFNKIKDNELLQSINSCSIVQYELIEDFIIKTLKP